MEVLSSFAMGLAVNFVHGFINLNLKNDVQKEIELSFENALSKWTENESIARAKRYELRGILRKNFLNGGETYTSLSKESNEFLVLFNQELCKKQKAYNFLKAITDEQHYQSIKTSLTSVENRLVGLGDDVEDIKHLLSANKELKQEWENQLNEYKGLLDEYKPKTALNLLESLNSRLIESGLGEEDLLLSKIEYLRALSLELLGSNEDAGKAYIKAFNLNKGNFIYKEKACFYYYKHGILDKCRDLMLEILEVDPFNIIACATKVLLRVEEFESVLESIPRNVCSNLDFKRIVYANLRLRGDIKELYSVFPEMLMKEEKLELLSLEYENLKSNLYIVEIALNSFLKGVKIEYHKEYKISDENIKIGSNILTPFLLSIKGTEIENKYSEIEFFKLYIDYLQNKDELILLQLKKSFEKIKAEQKEILFIIIADLLQKSGSHIPAFHILKDYQKDTINILTLMFFCAQRAENLDLMLEVAKRFNNSVDEINVNIIGHFLQFIRVLGLRNSLDELDIEKLKKKQFEFDFLKTFFEAYVDTRLGGENEQICTQVITKEVEILTEIPVLATFLMEIYYTNKKYTEVVHVFDKYVSNNFSPFDLSMLLDSLLINNGDNRKLLKWLEYWRLNFGYEPRYIRIELNKLGLIGKWNDCLLICEFAIENDIHEDFISYYAISCYHLEDKKKFIEKLNLITTYNFQKVEVALQIVNILYHFDYFKEGLELCYYWAKEKGDKQARTQFFTSFLRAPEVYFKAFDKVKKGCYVHYNINNDTDEYIQIVKETEDNLSSHLLGKKVGDKIEVNRKFGKAVDTIKILQVCNKFLSLKLEIMNETKNPQSGLDLQMFNILDYESPLDIFDEIAQPVNDVQDNYEQYYSQKINFCHLPFIQGELNRNFIKAYYKLVDEKKGLLCVDPKLFPIFPINSSYTYILDFTSLLNFFESSRRGGEISNIKFKISSFLMSLIKQYREDVVCYWKTNNYLIDREYYEELQLWIDKNCEIISPVALLDIIKEKEMGRDVMFMYLMNQVAMVEEFNDSVLITDDLVFYRLYPLQQMKLISTNLFKAREIVKKRL